MNKNIYCFQFYLLEGRRGGKSFIKHVNCNITVLEDVQKKRFSSVLMNTLYIYYFSSFMPADSDV